MSLSLIHTAKLSANQLKRSYDRMSGRRSAGPERPSSSSRRYVEMPGDENQDPSDRSRARRRSDLRYLLTGRGSSASSEGSEAGQSTRAPHRGSSADVRQVVITPEPRSHRQSEGQYYPESRQRQGLFDMTNDEWENPGGRFSIQTRMQEEKLNNVNRSLFRKMKG